MKAVILARVSTEEQKDAGNSLPAQIERMKSYCDRKGFEIAKTFSFDESAYKTKRDEFDKILEFLKQTDEKIAVCFDKVDRLSRNVFDKRVSELYEKAVADEIELHFVSDGQIINSNISAVEKFQFGMSLGLAKYYSDAISDNVKRAFETKRRKGEITGKCVLGYINTTDFDGNKTIKPDPQRAHLIVKIFELYASTNHSMKTVLERVTKEGLKTREGKKLTKSTVERILNESFYYGFFYSKKYTTHYPHKYQPLISKELFDKCQRVKEARRKQPSKVDSKDFILKGLLTCSNCGCMVTPELKRKKSGREYKLYSCTNSKGICKRRYVNEDALLEPIHAILERFESITEQTQNLLVDELRKTSEAELKFHKAQVQRIQNEYNQYSERKNRLVDMFLDQSITKQDYDKKLQEISDYLQQLSIELEEHTNADHDYKTTVGTVISVARRAKQIFNSSETHEKRQFVNMLVQNPYLDDRKMVFELRKPFDLILDLSSLQQKATSLSTDRPSWLRGRDSNPRPTG
jgi:site-specific DNA recombinase